jgi:dCTP deaminase
MKAGESNTRRGVNSTRPGRRNSWPALYLPRPRGAPAAPGTAGAPSGLPLPRSRAHVHQVRPLDPPDAEGRRIISYGVSSYGYDMRVAPEFKIFTNALSAVVDPKAFDARSFVEYEGEVCIVPPNSFALARSVEYFRIPRNVLTICVGKSTYARCGIITNVTPFEPEWEGHVTLEISNTTPLPAKIYANEGICQVLFFEADADDVCEVSYADKAGKYQAQRGVTLPRL